MGDTRPAVALDAILRRVPPRSLAACRCVCRKWRGIIDSRRLLRSDLLPLSVGGIFFSLGRAQMPPALFARPSPTARRILVGRQLERRPEEVDDSTFMTILDCRNGLLLFSDLVVNPATRLWSRVPSCPAWPDGYWLGDAYLVFDPWVSPHHFKVMLIQDPSFFDGNLQVGSEWPPPSYTMSVYSSSTGAWEERPFVRDDSGDPAGTFGEARSATKPETRHAVYWQGALYVHCQGDFIMRIALSDYRYRVIKLPAGLTSIVYYNLHLGKSKNGVYFAVTPRGLQLQVWFLDEDDSSNKAKWLLKYDINLQAVKAHFKGQSRDYPVDRPWVLRWNGRCYDDGKGKGKGKGEVEQEWDFDGDDNVLDIEEGEGSIDEMRCDITGCVSVLGFHPFKEVAFLHLPHSGRIVACHLDSSKLQDLGPLGYCGTDDPVDTTFVYAPCWLGELSEHN
jgi:hypothetical protein